MRKASLVLVALATLQATAFAQNATFQSPSLTPETALVAARAAMEACRKQGFQVSVAVVDRAGLTQVLLRDRLAGAHTPTIATDKAWTAASFRSDTSLLAGEMQAGKPMSGLKQSPHVMAVAGGVLIEGAGSSYGAIGVSGAPGGDSDEGCAKAGVAAIAVSLEF